MESKHVSEDIRYILYYRTVYLIDQIYTWSDQHLYIIWWIGDLAIRVLYGIPSLVFTHDLIWIFMRSLQSGLVLVCGINLSYMKYLSVILIKLIALNSDEYTEFNRKDDDKLPTNNSWGWERRRRKQRGRKGFDPPGNLEDGGGFRSAGERGIEEGWVPTWGEAGTGLKVSAVGLMEEGGAARSDGAKAEVRIHEGSTDKVRAWVGGVWTRGGGFGEMGDGGRILERKEGIGKVVELVDNAGVVSAGCL